MESFSFNSEYLVLLRAREPGALSHFYEHFRLPIRNKLRQRFRWDQTEDLAHDVLIAALVKIDAGEPRDPAKLPGYIFGICRLAGLKELDVIMKNRNWVDLDSGMIADKKDRSAEERLLKQEDSSLVRRALKRLPARDRQALTQEYFKEDDRAASSREMGVSRRSFRLIKFRALQRLRNEMDKGTGGC